jgi:hypothetical protein
MHGDVGGGDHSATAHRFDAREIEAFAEARAHRRHRMPIEQTQVSRGNPLEEIQATTTQPRPDSVG